MVRTYQPIKCLVWRNEGGIKQTFMRFFFNAVLDSVIIKPKMANTRFYYGEDGRFAQTSIFANRSWVHLQGWREKRITITGEEFLSLVDNSDLKSEVKAQINWVKKVCFVFLMYTSFCFHVYAYVF